MFAMTGSASAASCDAKSSVTNELYSSIKLNGWWNGCNNHTMLLQGHQNSNYVTNGNFDAEWLYTSPCWGVTVEVYRAGYQVAGSPYEFSYANSRGDGWNMLLDGYHYKIISIWKSYRSGCVY